MITTIEIPIQSDTNKPYIKQGDTIPEWTWAFDVADGVSLTGATIRMQIYWNGSKKIDITNDNGITINSELQFTVDERLHTEDVLPQGIGIGDLEITDSSGERFTYTNIKYNIIKEYTI